MSVFHNNILAGASGASGAAEPGLYADDVFSCFLYKGTDGTQTITNGIDLDGEGGMVWIQPRTIGTSSTVIDTERGSSKIIHPNGNFAEETKAVVTGFNSNGFGVSSNVSGYHLLTNYLNADYVSWAFRKAPGFFDCVTWTTTTGSAEQIAHNLGSTPGMIIVKRTDSTGSWIVWHRSLSNSTTSFLRLESNVDEQNAVGVWGSNAPNSTHFEYDGGASGRTFVAYVFAHDDQSFGTDSDEAIIKCDSYTGNGSTQTINVGFEPQWVMAKRTNDSGNWNIYDIMRGMASAVDDAVVSANTFSAETATVNFLQPTATGFQINTGNGAINNTSDTYIYVAIRRPHKPPSAATDVFAIDTSGGTSPTPPWFNSGFVTDFVLRKDVDTTGGAFTFARLLGKRFLRTSSSAAVSDNSNYTWDFMNGFSKLTSVDTDKYGYLFRRAPGFMDVVAYNGSSSVQNIPHNLEVEPELLLIKIRGRSFSWEVYNKPSGNTKYMQLNTANGHIGNPAPHWNQTTPTSTHFTVGTNAGGVNYDGDTHIAYLFASLSGVSKIGSYTGTGSNIGVDCGFTAGARFVMIKRTDATGDWYVFDTDRGIVSGNDPYWRANVEAAQVTGNDYIDPLNSGFTVTSSAPADLNASGGTYLFLAIA
jgi:hypothetical protein